MIECSLSFTSNVFSKIMNFSTDQHFQMSISSSRDDQSHRANDSQGCKSTGGSETLSQFDSDEAIKRNRKFTSDEDQRLSSLVEQYGRDNWCIISQLMPDRNARQCRERWTNYLQPYLRMGAWTPEEDEMIEAKFAVHGTKWNKISKFFIHRSPISLRNRHMVLTRGRRKTRTDYNEATGVVPCRKTEAPPAHRGHVPTPFSDEELKLLYEDIFA
jgi:hypothetical protein